MKHIFKMAAVAELALIFSCSMAFAANVSKSCTEEIITISKGSGFDMQKFAKDLVPAVAKAKLQAKAPFGKPKDVDKTDIGMSFGCLKSFPESLDEIQSLLKDVGLGVASLANGNGNSSISKSNVPALKECDAIFNPNKKFCYDGGIYDLCDGMSYNPTTHICSGDIANRALCNEVQYNPLKQKCENNVLLLICGKAVYNPATHGCKDNSVFALPKCGKTVYDTTTHGCYNNTLFPKCGETIYDPQTQVCKDNVLFIICGKTVYDPAIYGCKDNVVLKKCSETLYDPKTHFCKDNVVFVFPNCNERIYDPRTHDCKDNVVLARCGESLYDPKTHFCKDNAVFTLQRCGATEFYNPKTQECRFGSVFEK